MKQKLLFALTLFGLLYLSSACQHETSMDEPVLNEGLNNVGHGTLGIDNDIINLNETDATIVAQLFLTREKPQQSRTTTNIKNIVPIKDEHGRPAIYAVNFQDGYILVSATKSYYPILARVEHGTFSLDNEPTGENVIIQDMLANIKAARDSIIDFNCSGHWFQYEQKQNPERPEALSRAIFDDYWEAYNEWYDDITDDYNCKVYKLYGCNEIHTDEKLIPEDVYERFCNIAANEDLWEGTEYNWKNTAYIVARFNPGNISCGPYLKTEWGQSYPYNKQSKPLGCVTIAVGQLMKFFEYPATFNWSDMPNNYATLTLQNFLADLRSELHVSDSGGSTIVEANRVLSNYGYILTRQSHNTVTINNSLLRRYPVYARGADNAQNGHAWIIDGFETNKSYTEYILFRLSETAYPNFEYVLGEGDNPWYDSPVPYNYYHMNWGWAGSNNGWYLDNYIQTPNYNYTNHRQEIIITGFR